MKQFHLNALAAAVFFLVGCGGVERIATSAQSPCVTQCGMTAAGNCLELQGLESEWVREMVEPLKLDEASICSALKGWVIAVHEYRPSDRVACADSTAWPLPKSGTCVVGYTHEGSDDEARWVEVTDV